jgi:hypothetical protein
MTVKLHTAIEPIMYEKDSNNNSILPNVKVGDCVVCVEKDDAFAGVFGIGDRFEVRKIDQTSVPLCLLNNKSYYWATVEQLRCFRKETKVVVFEWLEEFGGSAFTWCFAGSAYLRVSPMALTERYHWKIELDDLYFQGRCDSKQEAMDQAECFASMLLGIK